MAKELFELNEKIKVEVFEKKHLTEKTLYQLYVNGEYTSTYIDKQEALDAAINLEKRFKELGGVEKKELIYSSDTSK